MKNCILFAAIILFAMPSCKSVSRYPIDSPGVRVDTNLVGIWKMDEDTDTHDFFVIEKYNDREYAFTYMNQGGNNRIFENFRAYFSNVQQAEFINVAYDSWMDHDPESSLPAGAIQSGYFFMKVLDMDKRGSRMALTQFRDSSLRYTASSAEVRQHIVKNMNNPAYFERPVHFHKILPLMYCR